MDTLADTLGPPAPPPALRKPRRSWVHATLFGATFVSAMLAQTLPRVAARSFGDAMGRVLSEPRLLLLGLPFAITLMAILVAHEMGHYLTARRYGVDQSLPYFIPAPTFFGTLGAIILMRSQPADRRVLLNVAVMGPYAGLLLAIPATAWGLAHSVAGEPPLRFGSSLLFGWLNGWFAPEVAVLDLHPVALAGWVGLFVTSLNLIPAAQLDGGHVAYALFGRKQERFSLAVVLALLALGLALGFERGTVWIFWALFLFVIGVRHPPVRDEMLPL
ncbi:MAG: site-2 protease family protein, partial [Deltaproteobacteria bacterium]|nr:site-2 protease family protein [Deltaproteobacteria bacterium]